MHDGAGLGLAHQNWLISQARLTGVANDFANVVYENLKASAEIIRLSVS